MNKYKIRGFKIGATVRQYHNKTLYNDAIITAVHDNGALDVQINGKKYGWSVNTCKLLQERE